MSRAYMIFERIEVQRANCIAGFTYGFPSVTHFLGFAHALSRKISQSNQVQLQGCAVICHQHQIQAYRPKYDYVFSQSKNPPILKKHATKNPPIIEEGKMNMCVSLIIECSNFTMSRHVEIEAFKKKLIGLAYQHRLAGGSIHNIQAVHVFSEKSDQEQQNKQMRKIKRMLLPGFVLMDRSDLLEEHYQNILKNQLDAELIDAWLDFSAIKYKANPNLENGQAEADSETKAEWVMLDKPAKGWLMPITNGYKAIAPICPPGEAANTRDPTYPFCFVEAVHSIGEWRSLHRIQQITDILWQYHYEDDWYLCRQKPLNEERAKVALVDADDIELADDFLNSL